MPKCSKCKKPSVVQLPNSEVKLCRSCFAKYFEKKSRKTIRVYKLLSKKPETVGVDLSKGKKSQVLMYILERIEQQRHGKLKLIKLKDIKKSKLKKIAIPQSLDDEAEDILINQISKKQKSLGPKTTKTIKPLYSLTEEEINLFAKIKKFTKKEKLDPSKKLIKKELNNFEKKYPGTKYSIVKAFLETLNL